VEGIKKLPLGSLGIQYCTQAMMLKESMNPRVQCCELSTIGAKWGPSIYGPKKEFNENL
jgi:hypothetical protein